MYVKQEMYNGKMTDILYADEGYLLQHKETKFIYGSVSLENGRKESDYEEIKEESKSSIPSGGSASSIDPMAYKNYYNLSSAYDAEAIAAADVIEGDTASSTASGYTEIDATNAELAISFSTIDVQYFQNLTAIRFPKLKYIFGLNWWRTNSSDINSVLTTAEYPELLQCITSTGCLLGGCSAITKFSAPKLQYANVSIVTYCNALISLNLPNLEYCGGNYIISYCPVLKYVNLSKYHSDITRAIITGGSVNMECLSLGDVDTIDSYIMQSSGTYTNFTTYIFNVSKVPTLGNVTYIRYNTTRYPHFASGGDGSIYVPDALVDDFKTATNWSTLAEFIKPMSSFINTWED